MYYTYEVLDKREGELYNRLRAVPPSELNADVVAEEATPAESRGEPATPNQAAAGADGYDIIAEDSTAIMKNNRLTVDDASRQTLSHTEIEDLKKSSAGKDVIEKILANHIGLDEKTAFSKAKYTLRKSKKYLKRFTVLPMELGYLIDFMILKEPGRILEMREESLGLVCAWSNAHFSEPTPEATHRGGRWLAIDDAGGLVVAAMAERMGLLHADDAAALPERVESNGPNTSEDQPMENGVPEVNNPITHNDFPIPASSNSITLLHPAVQPNVSLLKYFGYNTNSPDPAHPLHTHLKSLSWLQLLHPEEDPTYREPPSIPESELQTMKSGKRGTYFKKQRRWERCKAIVDDARQGGFDGLVIASHMDPRSIMPHVVPLLRGGGHVVIYSPTAEPLVNLTDLYSKERRTAYLALLAKHPDQEPDSEDFPVDPRLLLAPNMQTSRVREWQVLPGRTHPMMTSRGGSEGYIFTARRVIPLEGGVEARGRYGKKRKAEDGPGEVVAGKETEKLPEKADAGLKV